MNRLTSLLFLLLVFTSASAKEAIHFGVFAYMGVEKTREKYQPLVDYLNTKLDNRVVLDILTQEAMDQKIAKGELDIATTNPTHFLVVRNEYPLSGVLATLISVSEDGKPTSKLGGVIFVRPESSIYTLEDIKGKTVETPSLKHMGGFRSQAYELYKNGIDILNESKKIIENHGSHQEVVHDVLMRKADVGFIRDGILEEMIAHGEIRTGDVRVIQEKDRSEYPYRVSTQLYPEWPVFALPHTKESDTKAFVAALFSLQPTEKGMRESGIYGYTLPADYLSVEELARHLRLPPFDHAPDITLLDIWKRYKIELIVSVAALLLVLIYYTREQRRKKLFESLLSNIGDGVYGVNHEGKCTWINAQALKMIGYSEKEVLDKDQHALFHHHKMTHEVYDESECPIYRTLNDRITRTSEEYLIRRDGSFFPVSLTVASAEDGAIVVFRDITEEKTIQETLQNSELSLKKAQAIAHMGSWEFDIITNKLIWSDEIYHIFEIDPLQFRASYEAFVHAIHPEDRENVNRVYLYSLQNRQKYTITHRLLMEDGRIKWVREVGDTEYDKEGNAILSRGTVQDITEQVLINQELLETKSKLETANAALKLKNNQLKELAMIDGLTQIANRRFFDQMYEKSYKEVLRDHKTLAILMIDVDHFKRYNDNYGHAKGDACLIAIAKVLKKSLKRPSDVIARYGGEEFVVLLKSIDFEGAKQVSLSLVKAVEGLKISHEYSSAADHITISIGMAFKEAEEEITKESLLKKADDALYEAKAGGRNRVSVI
ncbi:diguanylate cyclase with PAS/PAC sensor [Sulfuricurvum kujiense DSM 16994]|uniref:diguanylate cyclase n=1 Tax=Sulfuricurvum kujiense (strain ATCC BAA-921 / DSM 16994 / JCM 11577 / YK-1) TaxID=709032 RepID=E4U0K2_SULKY|nr:diguanylate cyclase [Sulfuricurvum kujiense]ADR34319.1 diguanylate cyclase with PAS/PAC sensor [Sulfuricurvum kujiense DSM 16994]